MKMRSRYGLSIGVCLLSNSAAFTSVAPPRPLLSPETKTKISTSPPISTKTVQRKLNKESTSAQVLDSLVASDKLASYAGPNGVAVVTGGSGGIGIHTVEALSKVGMRIYLCARDPFAARKSLERAGLWQSSKISIQKVDLSDLESVTKAVDEIIIREKGVDLILNGAGVNSVPEHQSTEQNFELQFGVNYLAHYYMTRLLFPHLKKNGRVVNVASEAHSTTRKMRLDDVNFEKRPYAPWSAYSQSKLGNVLFAKELQRRCFRSRNDVISLCLHPGIVQTNLWRHTDPVLVDFVSDYVVTKTPEQGSATSTFCCLANEDFFEGGEYVKDCQSKRASFLAEDEILQSALWEGTEKMIRRAGFFLPTFI